MSSSALCAECASQLAHLSDYVDKEWAFIEGPANRREPDGMGGKWLVFPTCDVAVECWDSVCKATRAGDLWMAKVSLCPADKMPGSHALCVYTPLFSNPAEVFGVGNLLFETGIAHPGRAKAIHYKPDLFTEWDESGSIYRLRRGGRLEKVYGDGRQLGIEDVPSGSKAWITRRWPADPR